MAQSVFKIVVKRDRADNVVNVKISKTIAPRNRFTYSFDQLHA